MRWNLLQPSKQLFEHVSLVLHITEYGASRWLFAFRPT